MGPSKYPNNCMCKRDRLKLSVQESVYNNYEMMA